MEETKYLTKKNEDEMIDFDWDNLKLIVLAYASRIICHSLRRLILIGDQIGIPYWYVLELYFIVLKMSTG